ncbi:MAG: glycoside hydrolase family 2 [Candidatus Azobacteroides sp.]|nr:glycoside hydrolase family 2 [Candidatus Azobacteroides sp.]
MRKCVIFLLALLPYILLPINSFAQSRWNFGYSHRQEVLPQSKTPIQTGVPVPKVNEPAVFVPTAGNELILSSGWEMCEMNKNIVSGAAIFDPDLDTQSWYNATVPGTVLTTLVNQGVYPNPYFGLNNVYIPDTLCRMDWMYRVVFDAPQQVKGKHTHLILNGINYKAEVYLNSKLLGTMVGAFKRGIFDITHVMKEDGKNVLAVRIIPPNNPGIPAEPIIGGRGPNGGILCLDGPTFISSIGWDWMPGTRDRNIGIWQDVRLSYSGDVQLFDPQIITDLPLPDTTSARITVKGQLRNLSDKPQRITFTAKIGDMMVNKTHTLLPGETSAGILSPDEFSQLIIQNPKLWWPNGYGPQNLYTAELSVSINGEISDRMNVRFGIREFSYQLMVDTPEKENLRIEYTPTKITDKGKPLFNYEHRKTFNNEKYKDVVIPAVREGISLDNFTEIPNQDNPFFLLKINGKEIFCRGGNWGMDDAMKRVSREQLEPYFRLHKEANLNMIRNWTGESSEEVFYELADEYGMLIFNDFWMSTGDYNLNPVDDYLFRDNVKDMVVRFRNHPSIAVWGPRNEGYAPSFLENLIQQVIAEDDGTRHYHGNSRFMNLRPSGPWGYRHTDEAYRLADGFNTELGSLSFATSETNRKFVGEKDLWPLNDVYTYHNMQWRGDKSWEQYIVDLEKLGKEPSKNIDEFAQRAQVINYIIHRDMFESWNHKMWDNASGVLLWMTHPAWYSTIWQIYTWDYETNGSYYGSKTACEPLHLQWNIDDNKVIALNTTLHDLKDANAEYAVYSPDGKKMYSKKEKLTILADRKTDCFVQDYPGNLPDFGLIRLTLTDSKGKEISRNDYWYHGKDRYDLSPISEIKESGVTISGIRMIKGNNNNTIIKANVKNNAKSVAVSIKMNVRDKAKGASLLPVYASDGYFNLLPGETREITFDVPFAGFNPALYKLTAEGINVQRTETVIR